MRANCVVLALFCSCLCVPHVDAKPASSRRQVKSLRHAIEAGATGQVSKLLKKDPSLLQVCEFDRKTPLAFAIWMRHVAQVRGKNERLVKQHEMVVDEILTRVPDVNFRCAAGGGTALHEAASAGLRGIGLALLERGADVNARVGGVAIDAGETPLHGAVQVDVEFVRLLLSRGADPRARSTVGFEPIHLAAGQHGGLDVVRLLVSKGADVRAPTSSDSRSTTLHSAACGHNGTRGHSLVKYLLGQGLDINSRDRRMRTPLHCAAEGGSEETVNLLISLGANLHAKDVDSRTPLHFAATSLQTDLMGTLLRAGADPRARDKDGKTASDLMEQAELELSEYEDCHGSGEDD